MRGLAVGNKLLVAALWLSQCGCFRAVHCRGAILFPPVQFVDQEQQTRSAIIAAEADATSDRRRYTLRGTRPSDDIRVHDQRQRQDADTAESSAATPASSVLMQEIDRVIPDCGASRTDVEPVDVTGATQFMWQYDVSSVDSIMSSEEGPCEIWIDSSRMFASDNCASTFSNSGGSISLDYSVCRGECLLRLYWMTGGSVERDPEPMKQCVPIRYGITTHNGSANGSDGSGKAPDIIISSSSDGNGSDDSSSLASPVASSRDGDGSSNSSSSNSKHDGSLAVLDALATLHDVESSATAFVASVSQAAIDAVSSNWHDPFAHPDPQPATSHSGQRQSLVARDPRYRREAFHYSTTHIKTETHSCSYTSDGFTCTSTEYIADSVVEYVATRDTT